MQIKDLMTDTVGLIDPTMTLSEVSHMMREYEVGALPVAADDRLIGMVTDRDIVVRAIAEGKDPKSATAREAMSEQVLYCFEDQTPEEAAASMGENQIRRLPVLDRGKRLVGIVSLGDIAIGGARGEAAEALEQISATMV